MLKPKIVLKMLLLFLLCQTHTSHSCGDYLDFDTETCVSTCGKKIDSRNHICYSKCPEYKQYYINSQCSDTCDYNAYYDGKCDNNACTNYKTEDSSPKQCTSVCPSKYPYYGTDQKCVQTPTCDYSYEYECFSNCASFTASSSLASLPSHTICFKCDQTSNKFHDSDNCVLNCPSERPYYDQYNECHASCIAPAKLHDLGSYECKTECGSNYIEFNNICFPTSASCPSGTKKNDDNKCECIDKYYEETESDGNIITICLSSGASCPSDKKYILNKKCWYAPDPALCKKIRKTITSPVNYECISECDFDELEYTTASGITFCVTQCPSEKPYKSSDGKTCVETCANNENLNEQTKTCTATCPGLGLKLYDSGATVKFKCYSGSSCPSTHLYFFKEKNVCLTNCSLLISDFSYFEISNGGKYYVDETNKECFKYDKLCTESKSGTVTYTLNDIKYECISKEDCKTLGLYLDNNKCVNSCSEAYISETYECVSNDPSITQNYYYVKQDYVDNDNKVTVFYKFGCPSTYSNTDLYQNDEDYICLSDCEECPKQYNRFAKKCVKCSPPTKDGLQNEGYYISTTYKNNGDYSKECSSNCPSFYPYYIDNECFKIDSPLIAVAYQIDGTNEYVINSCPDGYFLFDKKCYSGSCPDNSELSGTECQCVDKYYTNDNKKICLGKNEQCPTSYNYVNGKECFKKETISCDKNNKFLKRVPTEPENFECVDSCEDYKFTDNDFTYCLNDCSSYSLYPDPTQPESKICISECDSSKYFTDEANHLCLTSCPDPGLSLLNENDNFIKGKCISDYSCPQSTPYLYKINGIKLCISSCSITNSDKRINTETVLDLSNEECVVPSNCPYYYDLVSGKCVDECKFYQKIDNDGKKCVNNCNTDKPYLYETRQCLTSSCNQNGYFSEDGSENVCYKSCPSLEYSYQDGSTKICYRSCPIGQPLNLFVLEDAHKCVSCKTEGYIVPAYTSTNICYTKCPDSYPYYNEDSNECRNNGCIDDKNIRIDGTYKCIKESSCKGYIFNNICYSSLPENTETSSTSAPYYCDCIDKFYESNGNKVCLSPGDPCPSDKRYFGSDKKCREDCPNGDSDKRKKITIIGTVNFECKSCDNDEFTYTEGEKNQPVFCYDKCPEDKPYHKSGDKECLQKCNSATHFTDSTNFICYEICPNLATVDELNHNSDNKIDKRGECISDAQCPTNYPYLYEAQKICVSDCSKTSDFIFDPNNFPNTKTQLEASKKQCVSACSGGFVENGTEQCLDRCKDGQFVFGNICYEQCPFNSGAKIKYGTNECTTCPKTDSEGYKYLLDGGSDNYCYKECPEGSHISLDNSGNQIGCVSQCGNNLFLIEKTNTCKSDCDVGDGFRDSSQSNNRVCYEKCPEDIPFYEDGSNFCYATGCPVPDGSTNKFLQEGTHLCTDSCNTYSFNNVCYSNSCPDLTEKSTTADSKCECIYKYYEKNGGEIVCLGAGDACPSGKEHIVDGKCTNAECSLSGSSVFTRKILSSPVNYQCVPECDKEEFIYEETQAGSRIEYCVSKCPQGKPYYIYDTTGPRVCQQGCDAYTHFTDNINHICYTDCPNLNTIDETIGSTKLSFCIHDTKCPTNKPYMFNNKYCLSSCTLTKDVARLGNIETYLDKTTNQCIVSSETSCSKFIDVADGTGNDCVEKCAPSQFVYYSTTQGVPNKCYNECPNFIVVELMQCVDDCSSIGYYSNAKDSSDKSCHKTCPANFYTGPDFKCYFQNCPTKFLKISLNKCVSACELPANLNIIGETEGFTTQPKSGSGLIYCYDECPPNQKYHEYRSNLCLDSNNGYYLFDGTNELIAPINNKCPLDIPSTSNSYKYLFNNVCYQICPENTEANGQNCECSFKSYIENGIKVCLGPNEPCPVGKIYFDKYNICSSTECSSNSLRKTIETTPVNIQCYDDSISTCPYNEYLYGKECFTKCPENTYHVFGQYKCYTSCAAANTDGTKNYYTDKKNFICYEDCPGLITVDANNNYECVEGTSCAAGKYYYENNKKYCLSSCELTKNLGGETVADSENFFCTSTCGNKFKDIKSGECVNVCTNGSFLNGINGKECYDSIENLQKAVGDSTLTKYLVKNNLKYAIANSDLGNYYQITGEDIIYEECPKQSSANPTIKYYQDDMDKKCYTETECTQKKYIKITTNNTYKCVNCIFPVYINSVQSDEGFIKKSGSKECIETCNTPSNSPNFYYKTLINICVDKGDDTYKYLIEGTYEYTNACPNSYYLFNRVCYKYECPENNNTEYNAIDKKCECSYRFIRDLYPGSTNEYEYTCYAKNVSCASNKYFDQEYGCIDSCNLNRPFIKEITSGTYDYECVKECALGEFIYLKDKDGKKYCVDNCPSTLKPYHNFGDVNCIADCGDKFTDKTDNTCRAECDGLIILDEVNKKKGECIYETSCPDGKKLYAPLNLCISDCSKTSSLLSILGANNLKTYLFKDNECVARCSNTLNRKYISSNSKECVENCAQGEFYEVDDDENKKCVSSCVDTYVFETKQCVENCKNYYVIDEPTDAEEGKICYESCPETNKNGEKLYTKQSSTGEKKCVKCNKISDGYFFNDTKGICYSKCPYQARNHEDGNNKCIDGCTKEFQYEDLDKNYDNMYTCYKNKCNTGKNVNYQCYSSCNEVTGFELIGGECVCNTDRGYKFYKEKNALGDEIIKCLSADAQCPGTIPYLLDGKECVEKCDDGNYKDEEDKKCYTDISKTPKGKYYKNSPKIVFSKCQIPFTDTLGTYEGYYVKQDSYQNAIECSDTCPSTNKYHNIGDNICLGSCTGNAIYEIDSTYICTNGCPTGYYLFNTICYKDKCPDNSQYDTVKKECVCKYKYKEVNNVMTCLAENKSCDQFFDENKKCLDDCIKFRKQIKDTDTDYQCVDETACDYTYTETNKVKYCLKECEIGMYYTDGSKECKKFTSPIPCDYYDEINRICYQNSCPKLQKLADETNPTQNKFICLDYDECPSTAPNIYYEFKKTCFTSCNVATSFNSRIQTYATTEKNPNNSLKSLYRCVEDCSTNPTQIFADQNSKKCLEKCNSNTSGFYFFKNKCYVNCDLATGSGYYLSDTLECVDSCPVDYYKGEGSSKICYKNCPNYTKISTKTCVSCTNPNNPASIADNEGYVVLGAQDNICYNSCPMSAPYHDYGYNKCFLGYCNSTANHRNEYVFTYYEEDRFTCYSSCPGTVVTVDNHCVTGSDCPKLYPYGYTVNGKTTCYKDSCPKNMKATLKTSGTYTCSSSCDSSGVIYMQEDKCVTACDKSQGYDYYVTASTGVLGFCYKTIDECINNGYKYITQSKECKATCAGSGEFKIENNAISSKGSCVSSCPPDYPYYYKNVCYQNGCPSNTFVENPSADLSHNGYYNCVEECGNKIELNGKCSVTGNCVNQAYKFLYEKTASNKRCLSKCPDDKPFYFSDDYKCIEKCYLNRNYYFYNPNTKECTKSCKSTDATLFQRGYYDKLNDPAQCIKECYGFEYYYESEKICLPKCNDSDYFYSTSPRVCVKSCGITEKVTSDTRECVQSCPQDYPYTSNNKKTCERSCGSKYISESTKECVEKCVYPEIFLYSNMCQSKCPVTVSFYRIENDYYKCVASSGCAGIKNFPYQNQDEKECIAGCTGGTYKYTMDGNNICYSSCPSGYYLSEPSGGLIECKYQCKSDEYINGKYCRKSCDNEHPYVLKSPKSNMCYQKCPEGYYIDYINNNKECILCNEIGQYIVNDKCKNKCDSGLNYIGKNNVCKRECVGGDGEFYYPYGNGNYYCVASCPTNYRYYNIDQKECKNACSYPYSYLTPANTCYISCKLHNTYKFTDNNKCVDKCPPERPYHSENFICTATCGGDTKMIDETNQCVAKCNPDSDYRYQTTTKESNNKCDTQCYDKPQEYYYKNFKKSDYVCRNGCDKGEYERATGECADSCDQDSNYPFAKPNGNTYTCVRECDNNGYRYDNTKICSGNSCRNGYYDVSGLKICSLTCPPIEKENYRFFYGQTCVADCRLTNSIYIFTLPDNTCASECGLTSTHPYYETETKVCSYKCQISSWVYTKTSYGYECSSDCAQDKVNSNGQCVANCGTLGDEYIYNIGKKCVKRCSPDYKVNGKECVINCSTSTIKRFADNYICVDKCPEQRKFFDQDDETCLVDCPDNHQYYVEKTNQGNRCDSKCPYSSGYYIREDGKIAKKCIESCNNANTIGIYLGGSDKKECLKQCPSDMPYHEEYTANVICYEQCRDNYSHLSGILICKKDEECGTHYIDYDTKTCLTESKCKSTQYKYSDGTTTYCLNSCKLSSTKLYLTPDNKCVKDCSGDLRVYNETSCECQKLFYIDSATGVKNCLSKDFGKCQDNNPPSTDPSYGYNIPVYNSLECVNVCRTMLSALGECLPDFTCPDNSEESINSEGIRYCKCKYKWVKINDTQSNCLNETGECPLFKNYVVYETGECVESCPPKELILINTCVKECPENSQTVDNKQCTCYKNWITNEKYGIECLHIEANCPENKPFLVKATKECVNKCPDKYRLLYKNECRGVGLGLCDSFNYKEIAINDKSPIKDIADYTCGCEQNINWYYNISGDVVCEEGISDCLEIELKSNIFNYEVNGTFQCVVTCPPEYPYIFDYHCYAQCPEKRIANDTTKECLCPYFHIKRIDKYGRTRIECILNRHECDYSKHLGILELKECLEFPPGVTKKCPIEYPYQFNLNCYKECPENSHYDTKTLDSCSCNNLTLTKKIDGFEITSCTDECSSNKNIISDETKECLEEDKFSYIFNNVGYKYHCPEGTKLNYTITGKDNICICDENFGFWYKMDTQGSSKFVGLVCGLNLTSCLELGKYKYNVDNTKECVSEGQCATYKKFIYRKTCYSNCDGRKGNSDTHRCELDVTDATSADDLNEILKKEVFKIYEDNPNGFYYSNFGISAQIYAINQTVDEYKENLMKSNLTYIDFSKCIDKIYASNGLTSDDKLILLKIDVTNAYSDYLINPAEYELYSWKTEKLIDIAVCEDNEITVSYPIIENLNTFKRLRNLEINKTILTPRQQYTIAKKLHDEDNSIDAFDINNTLYSKLCRECVIDGKDLILSDRIPYLYPLKYSLCENNCTFAYTDYERGRVNCNCHYKTSINVKKKYSSNLVEVNYDEVNDNQQGPTNFPVLQCMEKYKIKNNGNFYFSICMLGVEFIFFIAAITVGSKALFTKIRITIFGENGENDQKNGNNINNNNNLNDIAVYTENRKLNAASSDRNVLESSAYPPPKTESELQYELDMRNAEFIPGEYVHLFFTVKDNGVTKQVERHKLPFRIKKSTKILYEKIDFQNSDGTLKPNKLIIVDNKDGSDGNTNSETDEKMEITLKQNKNSNNENDVDTNNKDNDDYGGVNSSKFYSRKYKRSINNVFDKKGKFVFEEYSDKDDNDPLDVIEDEDLYTRLRHEKRIKDFNYQYAVKRDRTTFGVMVFTFILDKIYATKLFLFRRKYDIFSVLVSLYLLYHTLILSLVTMFFNLSTLSKIFFEEYPTLSFYLLYGLYSNLIAWFIHRLLYCLVKNNTTIGHFVSVNKIVPNAPPSIRVNKKISERRMKKLNRKIKCKLFAYYLVQWGMLLFCFFYLCLFGSIYRGTKKEIFKTYGIALLEIFIIRVVYGILLGIFRFISIKCGAECLYNMVKFFDHYLS